MHAEIMSYIDLHQHEARRLTKKWVEWDFLNNGHNAINSCVQNWPERGTEGINWTVKTPIDTDKFRDKQKVQNVTLSNFSPSISGPLKNVAPQPARTVMVITWLFDERTASPE